MCLRLHEWSYVPVILVGSNRDATCEAEVLNAGAHAPIPIPIDVEKMIAGFKAVFRCIGESGNSDMQSSFYVGYIGIKLYESRELAANCKIKLAQTEYDLLKDIAINPIKVLSDILLFQKIWASEFRKEKDAPRIFGAKPNKQLEVNPKKSNFNVTRGRGGL